MIKLIKLREEDYWLYFVFAFSIIFLAFFMYAGVFWIRTVSAILGFGGLLFIAYILRRHYTQQAAIAHTIVCLIASSILALGAYFLTN